MKRTVFGLAIVATLVALPCASLADDAPAAPAAPTPDWTFPGNVSITNDYIFRGLSQTNRDPALQAGIEVDHVSGFYAGAWGSNISWLHDYNHDVSSSSLEIDVYGGYRTKFGDAIGLDVGLYTYYYPGNYPENYSYKLPYTTEGYIALSYSFVSLKYSRSFTNLFGLYDYQNGKSTSGSGYLDFSANYEFMPTWVFNGHVGHQWVSDLDVASYTDWKLGVTKNFDGGWSVAAAYTDTNADKTVYTFLDGHFQGRATGIVSVTKTF